MLKGIEGVEDVLLDKLLAIGIISLHDITEVTAEPLVGSLELDEELAATFVETAGKAAKQLAVETEAARVKAEEERKLLAETQEDAEVESGEEESEGETAEAPSEVTLASEPSDGEGETDVEMTREEAT